LKAIATTLKVYGGDPKAATVERVLRVSGFFHRKSDPLPVRLLRAAGPRYARDQIRAAFPPVAVAPKTPASQGHAPLIRPSDRAEVLRRAGFYLDTQDEAIQGQNGSGATFNAALKVIDGFDLTEDEALSLLLDRYNPRCVPPWSEAEMRHKVQDAAKHCQDRGHLLREGHSSIPALDGSPEPMPPDGEVTPDCPAQPEAQGRPVVRGFEWTARGLCHLKPAGKDTDGNERPPERVWVAPPFDLPGLVRDERSHGWRLLIAWQDPDGVGHEEAVPFELLSGEGMELARSLGQGGLVLPPEPGLRRHLLRYLCGAVQALREGPRVRLVDALGWTGGAFVLPGGEIIGTPPEPVRYAGDAPGGTGRPVRGTLEGWQAGVARFAVGNPRLAFAICCAFAGPLLDLVRPDGSGGFNLMGFSSKGKSTCLEAAASVWGRPDPLPTWRATSSGLEGIAATRNDGFLALDELSQVDPKEAGAVAYMLANGSAKARANREGGARTMRQWRLVFLSTGEQGLEDKMMEDGKRARAGQEVRVPDIPCPAAGMFEVAHGLPSLGALAEHLKAQARNHYGHAARTFLQNLCEAWPRRDALRAQLQEMERAWLAQSVPPRSDAQVRRVAGRFALVAVAGELAQGMGILPWADEEASKAASVCFKAWLDRRGFTGASEVHRGIEAVLSFLDRNGQSRFSEWGVREALVVNRAGFKKQADAPVEGWDYYINAPAWQEACQGFSASSVAKACIEAGILEPGKDGRSARSLPIPGQGKVRCYVIRAAGIARRLSSEEESA